MKYDIEVRGSAGEVKSLTVGRNLFDTSAYVIGYSGLSCDTTTKLIHLIVTGTLSNLPTHSLHITFVLEHPTDSDYLSALKHGKLNYRKTME